MTVIESDLGAAGAEGEIAETSPAISPLVRRAPRSRRMGCRLDPLVSNRVARYKQANASTRRDIGELQ
jgi:hypothetical protein